MLIRRRCRLRAARALFLFIEFESSGELLQPYMRETIARVLKCKVVDRFGLAELGVVAYEIDYNIPRMMVLDSEVWPESREVESGTHELVLTGFRNRLMPLIRYATGDNARVEQTDKGIYLSGVVGRIHDVLPNRSLHANKADVNLPKLSRSHCQCILSARS